MRTGLAAVFSDGPARTGALRPADGGNVGAKGALSATGIARSQGGQAGADEAAVGSADEPAERAVVANDRQPAVARLLGRGLVEPLDDMDKPAWNADVLDWLAEDLVAHQYDLKHTIAVIMTSRAYQLPSTDVAMSAKDYVFRGRKSGG